MAYSHLLIAIDLTDDCHRVLERAHKLCRALECQATLVHVVEPLTMAFGGDVPMDLSLLQQQQTEHAQCTGGQQQAQPGAAPGPIRHPCSSGRLGCGVGRRVPG